MKKGMKTSLRVDEITEARMSTHSTKLTQTTNAIFLFKTERAYIKYVAGMAEVFYKSFKIIFVAQETIDLNISCRSNVFGKYFMTSPISFSFLLSRVVLTVIFKFQITNIRNNIQINSKKNL